MRTVPIGLDMAEGLNGGGCYTIPRSADDDMERMNLEQLKDGKCVVGEGDVKKSKEHGYCGEREKD